MVDIIKCIDKPDCKSEDEIEEYFAGSYMSILSNEISFN